MYNVNKHRPEVKIAMGRFLNPGNYLFQISLNSEIYVDKSGLIDCTNKVVSTGDRYVCVSRPRRFGKSTTADMLVAYYDRSCDSSIQFAGLEIAQSPSYRSHLNRYDVIHLNIQDFLSQSTSTKDMVAFIEESVEAELAAAYPEVPLPGRGGLSEHLSSVFSLHRSPFVFVIDEWDCIFRVHKNDHDAQVTYLDWLRLLLKDKAYVGLAYMTGILPIKKYGQHSALNMFTEVSMIDPRDYAPYTGFTQAEVRGLCERYDMPYDQVSYWYDGYALGAIRAFNPQSVVRAMTGRRLRSYWAQTETFEALRGYINMGIDGLREKVTCLIAGERVAVNTEKFQNDMTTFGSSDDVLTLLVHMGYLTYSDGEIPGKGWVWIPNSEVTQEFVNCIEDGGWEPVARSIEESEALVAALLANDEQTVASLVEQAHQGAASILTYNDENSLSCALSLALYAARRTYSLHREMPAGKGFADLVLVPRAGKSEPAIVIELKYGGSARQAMDQIRERDYAHALREDYGAVLLVGIAYNPKTKQHTCLIERDTGN